MKRTDMIEQLVKIYDTRPKECSSYHIIDILIGAAERRGMSPPEHSKEGKDSYAQSLEYKDWRHYSLECGITESYGWDEENNEEL